MEYLLIVLALIAVVLAIVTFSYIRKVGSLNAKLNSLSAENGKLAGELKAKEEYDEKFADAREQAETLAREQHAKELQALKEQYEKSLEQMKETFKNLSNENSSAFKSQSAETINELLKPMKEKFDSFEKVVNETKDASLKQHTELQTRIEEVMKHSEDIGSEAKNLANALTGYAKVQGDFGEMLLTDILKKAGLVEGIHFDTQSVMTDENGHEIKSDQGGTMIPDVLVYYPDDTMVVIDSKVSLKAFNDYMSAEQPEVKKLNAQKVVDSISAHINELKNKNYTSFIPEGKRKVDFNIMFIPIEGAFQLMLDADPKLWQTAKDNNVLIVSQMTLTIVLNMIQMAWKQHSQEENLQKVFTTASEMMSQIKNWLVEYEKVGNYLGKAQDAYADSVKKVRDSNQSVINKIVKLEKMGVSTKPSQGKISTKSRVGAPETVVPVSFEPVKDTEDETENNQLL
jgi:DNA recombination protein RmuC